MKKLITLSIVMLFITNISYADSICGNVNKVVLSNPNSVTIHGTTIVGRIAEDATPMLLTSALANTLKVCIHTTKTSLGSEEWTWIIIDSIEK